MTTYYPSCPVHETIDLLPEVLQLIDRRLQEIFRDDPQTLTYRSIQLDLHKLAVCASAHIDAYYNHVLQCRTHICCTRSATGLSRASVYNHNHQYRKLRRSERLSKI